MKKTEKNKKSEKDKTDKKTKKEKITVIDNKTENAINEIINNK